LRAKCISAAGSRRTSAGTQVNEEINQQVQSGTGHWLVEARSANDILTADPGEMNKDLVRVNLTEY